VPFLLSKTTLFVGLILVAPGLVLVIASIILQEQEAFLIYDCE
jgi:hypothetical protein